MFEQNPLRVSFSSQKTNLACHLSYKTYKTEYSEPIKLTSLILELAWGIQIRYTHEERSLDEHAWFWASMPQLLKCCCIWPLQIQILKRLETKETLLYNIKSSGQIGYWNSGGIGTSHMLAWHNTICLHSLYSLNANPVSHSPLLQVMIEVFIAQNGLNVMKWSKWGWSITIISSDEIVVPP